MEEDLDKVEDDTSEEVVEESVEHMKMKLTSHMSPVTLYVPSVQ